LEGLGLNRQDINSADTPTGPFTDRKVDRWAIDFYLTLSELRCIKSISNGVLLCFWFLLLNTT